MSEKDTETDTEPDEGTETEAETETETAIGESVRNGSDERTETGNDQTETATVADVEALRGDVVAFAEDVEDRIIEREALENELEAYVRKRQRRGHARGWGPYLVLLYGTVMTIGAFFYLSGWFAILAMFVIWLSTLGLYTLMALVGFFGTAVRSPGRVMNRIEDFRS